MRRLGAATAIAALVAATLAGTSRSAGAAPGVSAAPPASVPAAQAVATAPRGYVLVDLGRPVGGGRSFASSITGTGQVVGTQFGPSTAKELFAWDRRSGRRTSLAPASDSVGSNDVGDVALTLTGNPDRAAYWDATAKVVVPLPGLSASGPAGARDRNDAGVTVGAAQTADGRWHPVRWVGGVAEDLAPGLAGNDGANAVNDAGRVVGSYGSIAARWEAGSTTPVLLSTLGGPGSTAYAVNDLGQIAGTSYLDTIRTRAFITEPGSDALVDITPPNSNYAVALAINDAGVAVGSRAPNENLSYAFARYPDGTTVELPGAIGGQDSVATSIDDRGWIAGRIGTDAVVWIPLAFADVGSGGPFGDPIQWLADLGIADGYGAGAFRPTDPATRQAVAAFLYRLAGRPLGPHPTCAAAPYADVPVDHPFCGEINWLATTQIEPWGPATHFRPGDAETRGEIAKQLARLSLLPSSGAFACFLPVPFPDVPQYDPNCGAIGWLIENHITTGYADGGFHPNAPVSRQAVAAFLQRYARR